MEATAQQLVLAFGVTTLAGLATGVGSAVAYFARRTNLTLLAVSLGFSGGVMLYVSFVEILRKGETLLTSLHGAHGGAWLTAAGFFAGLAVMGIIDKLVPAAENPHEVTPSAALAEYQGHAGEATAPTPRLLRMGMFSALAIGIHNFPEGLATFLATLDNPHLGIAIAVAIAIHNIPEGIAVSIPIFYATGSRRRAFGLSFLSGLSEPLGALVGWFVLQTVLTPSLMGVLFAAVAGIMVYISLDELLPTAREYGKAHQVLYGIVSGMAVMAVSLLLLK